MAATSWVETWLWENSAWEGQAEKVLTRRTKVSELFANVKKNVVAQGACPRQGVRDEDLSIAGMAEEITHAVEELFPPHGVDLRGSWSSLFSHWQRVEEIVGCF